jgi:hypothetical protein
LSNKRFYFPEKKREDKKQKKKKKRKKKRQRGKERERGCSLCFFFDSGGVL